MQKFLQIISLSYLDKIDISDYDGIYLGVDTCVFKYRFDNEIVDKNYLEKYKKILNNKILVLEVGLIPKFSEKEIFEFIKNIIDIFSPNLELTINDWGLYYYLKKNNLLGKIKINIGPNFYYQVRDPYASIIKPEKFEKISIDKVFYNNYFHKIGFNGGIEFFYPLHGVKFNYLDFPKYLYYPYIQYSFTRACPWVLKKAGEKVSKLILNCTGCDKNYYKQQVKQNLKWKDLQTESIYVPNGQYYKLDIEIKDINLDLDRIIFNHLIIENVDGFTKK